jgi:hypothetical protein
MKIYPTSKVIVKTIEDLACGICDKKFEKNNKIHPFESKANAVYDNDRIYYKGQTNNIHDTYRIFLCDNCVKGIKNGKT